MEYNLTTAPVGAPTTESSVSAVSWPSIFAGAVIAIAVTLIMLTLGSGIGMAAARPWPAGPSPTGFSVMAGIWLIATQWVASGIGGYITGRLRTKWVGTHTHEVFFRDTAHGFLTWALSAVIVAALAAATAVAGADSAVHTAAAVVSAAGASPQEAADAARKSAETVALFTALAMVIGAFIASVTAALGGMQRDEHP